MTHPRWLFGFSEPSRVVGTDVEKDVRPKNVWMNMIGKWHGDPINLTHFEATYLQIGGTYAICRLSFESLTQAEKILATLML